MTIQFQDERSAALLRHRNRAETTVPLCEQMPYPVWFSCRCKSYQVQRLKKVVSNNPGVADFATGLMNPVLNLPDGIMRIVPGPHRTPAS